MPRILMKTTAFMLAVSLMAVLLPCPSALADPEEDDIPLLIQYGDEGDNVVMLQLRLSDLGYFDTTITGIFGQVTEDAVIAFQKQNNLTADGKVGQQTCDVLFSNDAIREPITPVKKPEPKVGGGNVPPGNLRDWFTYVNGRWQKFEKCLVIDCDTGIKYYMIRVGGYLHADVEPATKDDCAKLLQTYGGVWSYNRRAVVVRIDGEYIAASTNGFPHGYETIPNNGMYLQVCIHFLNSRTHCKNLVCPIHQAMIRKAAGK